MIDSTLLLLAKLGSAVSTSEHVQELGWDITADTIRQWKTKRYPKRYAAQVAIHRPELEAHMVQNASDAIAIQARVAAKLAERLDANSDKIDARDLPAALKNTVVSWAISTDKYALMTGRPTARTETVTADDVLRTLEARGIAKRTSDGTRPHAIDGQKRRLLDHVAAGNLPVAAGAPPPGSPRGELHGSDRASPAPPFTVPGAPATSRH